MQIAKEFLERGKVLVPFDLETEIEEARPLLLDLLLRPEAAKSHLAITVPGNNLGYYAQDGSGGKDIRESVYYNPLLFTELRRRSLPLTIEERHMFEACDAMYQRSLKKAREIGRLLDAENRFEGRSLHRAMLNSDADRLHVLRFLLYPEELPPERGNLLARPHPDRDLLSLGLYENESGLFEIKPDGSEELCRIEPGYALAFRGSKFWNWMHRDLGFLPMRHKVVRPRSSKKRRESLVFFSHIVGDATYPDWDALALRKPSISDQEELDAVYC